MLQVLYDPLQLFTLGGVYVFALLHHVSGQLRDVRRRLQVLPKLDSLPLALLQKARQQYNNGSGAVSLDRVFDNLTQRTVREERGRGGAASMITAGFRSLRVHAWRCISREIKKHDLI